MASSAARPIDPGAPKRYLLDRMAFVLASMLCLLLGLAISTLAYLTLNEKLEFWQLSIVLAIFVAPFNFAALVLIVSLLDLKPLDYGM